jgi:drug/metabolite transporter (DMT)-like permease
VLESGTESLSPPGRLDSILLIVAVLGVSFSGPLIAATAAPALAIAFWRNAFGGAATIPVMLARRCHDLAGLGYRAVGAATLAGVAHSLHFATWVPSLRMTSVASATALVTTQSIFVAVIAALQGRRLPRLAWIGIAGSTAGAVLVTGADVGLSGRALVGDLLAVLGGLFAAVYVTIGARVQQRMATSIYTSICYATCALVLLGVCLVGRVPLSGYPAAAWLKIGLVTICAQLLGHSLINVVLRSASATVVSLAILFETPGAAVIAAVWLHQRPPWLAIPGIGLLLGGLVLVARSRGSAQPVTVAD